MSEHDLRDTVLRYESEFGKPRRKRSGKDIWQLRMEICEALAECGMCVSEAARKVYRSRNDVCYHIRQMQEDGFDPLDFHQLALMLGYVKTERNEP